MAHEKRNKNWMVRIGNLVEESIAKGIYELGQEAPVLSLAPDSSAQRYTVVGSAAQQTGATFSPAQHSDAPGSAAQHSDAPGAIAHHSTVTGSSAQHTGAPAFVTPEEKVWYRVPIPEGRCGDGSEYHIYIRKGCSDKLCVFFSGGGIAINKYMAARPVNGGSVAAWLPNYYWNNLRLFTQVMNIGVGITRNGADNPFDDWNFIVITYATGDMHVGDSRFLYRVSRDSVPEGKKPGDKAVLYFHGYQNFLAAMRTGKSLFPSASKLLIAGESAGAFAVPALAEQIVGEFYPSCRDVTLFSDSAQLLYKGWKRTLRDVWNARRELWMGANSRNITVDWYRGVCTRQGSRFRYLYSGSVRDYLLSAFYNDVTNKIYGTDSEIQEEYYRQMKRMIADLRRLSPEFSFFIHDWHRPLSMYKGGTIHTAVRQPEFTLRTQDDVTMAYWLSECVEGNMFDVGMQLLV